LEFFARNGVVVVALTGRTAVMTREPKTAAPSEFAAAAVGTMERAGVMAFPAVDEDRRVVGMVHLHDPMRAGAI